jgi:hypothetical protein
VVKVVATSVYSNNPMMVDDVAHGFVGRLEKPCLTKELQAVLSTVLRGVHAAAADSCFAKMTGTDGSR